MTLGPGVSLRRLLRYAKAIQKRKGPFLVPVRKHSHMCAYGACDRKSLLLWRRTRQEDVYCNVVLAQIQRAVMNVEELSDSDRSRVLSLLSGGTFDGGRYGPQSGEIVGILKQLIDEMSADLHALEKEELDQKANHRTLVQAKTEGSFRLDHDH